MQMLTLKPSKHDTTDKIRGMYEAADWLNNLGMLVPATVFIDGRLTRSGGSYHSWKGIKIAAKDTVHIPVMQGYLIHELVHAYQDIKGYLRAEKHVDTSNFNTYLLQRIEREAYWWQNEYMKEVHGVEGLNVSIYKRLGVAEFL